VPAQKVQSFENSWNFVLNFREQMANDKHYPKGKTKNPESKGKQL